MGTIGIGLGGRGIGIPVPPGLGSGIGGLVAMIVLLARTLDRQGKDSMTATATPTSLPRLATPEDTRPHLTARVVITRDDVLSMGKIRSIQAKGFSHDRTPIDDERQMAWWRWNHQRLEAWLYDDQDGNTVAYGCLRQEADGRWYSSVAVLPQFGGKGYGKAVTHHLIHAVEHDVWASARVDNPAAQKLHDDLYWDVLGTDGELVFYRTKAKIRSARLAFNLDALHGGLGQ